MKLARVALAAAVMALGAPVMAQAQQAPDKPFISLGDEMRARSTYIIGLSRNVPASRAPSRAQELTARAGGTLRHSYTNAFHGFAATMSSTALTRLLRDNDDIVSVQRDSVDWVFAKPDCSDPNSTHPSCGGDGGGGGGGGSDVTACGIATKATEYPWGVEHVDAENAHTAATPICGAGVNVYVLDTGADLDHPDLNILDNWDCTKPGCPPGGADDKNGHGTHVAGTAAAVVNGSGVIGVAPNANLYAVKVLGNSGSGFRSDIMAGIDMVAGMVVSSGEPAVINMSIGGARSTLTGAEACTSNGYQGSDDYYRTICNAANKGVVFVVAAGNEGRDTVGVAPAGYDDAVITVSAVDSSNSWPSWSNFGAAVDIAAPGVSVVSTRKGGGTTTMSGTSMASPHVAGAVALWLEQNSGQADYTAFTSAEAAITASFADIGPSLSHHEELLNAATLVGLAAD